MDKKYTIYINYENADNLSLANQAGWVTGLQHFLEKMLWELFEIKVNFLLDFESLKHSLGKDIKPEVFICVLSPSYVQSAACTYEMEQVYSNLFDSDGVKNYSSQRILKIAKHPVPAEEQPSVIRYLPSHDLYSVKSGDGWIQEIVNFSTPYITKEIWLKLADLTYDINELLKGPKIESNLPFNKEKSGNTIFLAETETELFLERHIIKRELEKYGYKVLPEQKLPTDFTELEEAIRRDLDACKLSIHLIGDSYKELITNSTFSVTGLQHKIATEYCEMYSSNIDTNTGDPAFSRLIWVSPRIKQLNVSQLNSFLDGRNRNLLTSTEVFQTSLKNFKAAIWEELEEIVDNRPSSNRHKFIDTGESCPEVYVIYDKLDQGYARFLRAQLQSLNIKLIEPSFDSDAIFNRVVHLNRLVTSDIIILYKGKVSEQWLRMKALEIMKAPGYGRKKSVLHKAIILDHHSGLDTYFFENMGFTLISEPQEYITNLLFEFKAQYKHG